MANQHFIGHITAVFTVIIWAITFISTKILLESFTPLEILFLRFSIGWLALWLINHQWVPFRALKKECLFASAGFTGVTMYFLFENIALTCTLTANVSVIVATAPFFTAILAWKILKAPKPGFSYFLGFIIAITGIALLSFNGKSLNLNPLGDILALMAALVWAIYSVITRRLSLLGYSSLTVTRRIFFYGLVFMIPCFLFEPLTISLEHIIEPKNILNLSFLSLGASALCFVTWTFCLKQLGAALTSAYIYLVPAISIIAANIILNEPISLLSAAGCLLTLIGLIVAEGRFFK